MLNSANEKNVKIFISCHKEAIVPDNGVFCPIQVGTALAKRKLQGMTYYDNEGTHISNKNKQYCELTAQYWAWKNAEADYYGFFHYRRYLSLNPVIQEEDGWGNIAYDTVTQQALEDSYLDDREIIENMVKDYDVIVPIGREFNKLESSNTVYEQFVKEHPMLKMDMDHTIKIISKRYPEYIEACSQYMNSKLAYECNMFIMRKELFLQYSEWLFTIFDELDTMLDLSEYSTDENRVVGYIAERLFGVYFTKMKMDRKYKCREVQKVYFHNTDKEQIMAPIYDRAIPIVLSANDAFVPYLSVFIQSVIENSSEQNNYDFVVLHKDITEKNRRMLSNMIHGRVNFSLRFFDMKSMVQNLSFFVDQHLSVETYFRLAIQDIMVGYDKVLYLDCDMVVLTDVADLYKTDVEKVYLAAVQDVDLAGTMKKDRERKNYVKKVLKLENPYHYFQAGVLVLNLKMFRENFTVKELFDVAASYKWRQHDQDVLNYLCRAKFLFLKHEWNVIMNWEEDGRSRVKIIEDAPMDIYQEYVEARKNPLIVHYAGYQKPWNVPECDYGEWFWKYAISTPYYIPMLQKVTEEKKLYKKNDGKSTQALVKEVDNQGIRIKGINDIIYVDGVMIKLINSFNRRYPIGSKKRNRLRNIVNKFVH